MSYTIVNQPRYGKLSGAYPNVVYTPKVNYTGKDKFTFKANDGKVNSNLATVSINISKFNNAPIAYGQNLTLLKNKSLIITLKAMDVDKNALNYKIIKKTSHGTLRQDGRKVTYTPTKDFIGEDYFIFRANDGSRNSFSKKISLKINDDVVTPPSDKNALQVMKTGQVLSYDENGVVVTDGSLKDDGYYQKGSTHNYKKDDVKNVIVDNVNGVMWQDDEDVATIRNTNYVSDALKYCDNSQAGGYSDWQLPTGYLLNSLLDKSKDINQEPQISSIFKNLANAYYATLTKDLGYQYFTASPRYRQVKIAFTKNPVDLGFNSPKISIRCARASDLNQSINLKREDSGIVTESKTKLQWQDTYEDSSIKLNWKNSISYCENLTLGGYSDWRLPNFNELLTLTLHKDMPQTIFQNYQNDGYWSSSSVTESPSSARFLKIDSHTYSINGIVEKSYELPVRCVRDSE